MRITNRAALGFYAYRVKTDLTNAVNSSQMNASRIVSLKVTARRRIYLFVRQVLCVYSNLGFKKHPFTAFDNSMKTKPRNELV